MGASLRKSMTRTAKRDHPNNQNRQLKLLPGLTILTVLTRHVYPHSQNKQLKLLPGTDNTPPGRVGTITVKVVSE